MTKTSFNNTVFCKECGLILKTDKPCNRCEQNQIIEDARARWSETAKKYDWYKQPFFVQVWLNADGSLNDAVSFKGLNQDIIINLN